MILKSLISVAVNNNKTFFFQIDKIYLGTKRWNGTGWTVRTNRVTRTSRKTGRPGQGRKGNQRRPGKFWLSLLIERMIFSVPKLKIKNHLGSSWSSRSKRITWWSRCTRIRCTNSRVLPGEAMNDSLIKRMTHKWWVIKQSALKNQKPIKACLHVTFNFSIYSYMLRDVITWPHVTSVDQSKFIWPHVTPCDTS